MTDNKPPVSARLAAAAALLGLPALALGHPGHPGDAAQASLVQGLLHPLTGLDHLLAMLAVGLWAAQLQGRAAWMLPGLFPAVMVAGAALAAAGMAMAGIEPLIALSVVVLGVAVTFGARPGLPASAALVGLFAFAHGQAHGVEMPAGGDLAGYVAGFVGATIFLHLVGLFLGMASQRWRGGMLARAGGTAIAITGCALLMA